MRPFGPDFLRTLVRLLAHLWPPRPCDVVGYVVDLQEGDADVS